MGIQTIQQKRATAAVWKSKNPVLLAGELGFETDTGNFKMGNGSSAWNELNYAGGVEEWTFVMEDDTEVTKKVSAWTSGT